MAQISPAVVQIAMNAQQEGQYMSSALKNTCKLHTLIVYCATLSGVKKNDEDDDVYSVTTITKGIQYYTIMTSWCW